MKEEVGMLASIERFKALLEAARNRKKVGQVRLDEYESLLEVLKLTHEQLTATKGKVMELVAENNRLKNYAQQRASDNECQQPHTAESGVHSEDHKSTTAKWPGLSWRLLIRDWQKPSERVHDLQGDGSSWFDELVVGDWLHIEWMHGRKWWMRLGDACIFITVAKERPAVIEIRRGDYDTCPTAEEEAQTLAETDPDDDPYGPREIRHYYTNLPLPGAHARSPKDVMVAVNPKDLAQMLSMLSIKRDRFGKMSLKILVDVSNDNCYVWKSTRATFRNIATALAIEHENCLQAEARFSEGTWKVTFGGCRRCPATVIEGMTETVQRLFNEHPSC